MIRIMLHNQKTDQTRYGDETLFTEWTSNPDLWSWADFNNEEPEKEKELFHDVFELHPLVISDAQRERHPPKLEAFDGYFFLLVSGLDKTSTGIDFGTLPISFFVGHRFLVTRRALESISIDKIWRQAKKGNVDLSNGSAHTTYMILRQITDRYTNIREST